jgi:hypothetical protein
MDMYLLTDRDVKDIVDMVMCETYIPRRSASISAQLVGEAEEPEAMILPTFDGLSNSIIPRSVTVAEPATTISTPRTSFASMNPADMQVHTKITGRDDSTTTTVVSRRSVAEIT